MLRKWLGFQRIAGLTFGIVATVGAWATSEPEVETIQFIQDMPGTGDLIVEEGLFSNDQRTFVVNKGAAQSFELNGVRPSKIRLNLFVTQTQNLPEMVSRIAHLESTIRVKRSDVKIKDSDLEIDTDLDKRLTCEGLITAKREGKALKIVISAVNLSHCDGRKVDELDPDRVGKRDVRGKQDVFHNLYSLEAEKQMGAEFVSAYNAENKALILADDHPTSVYVQNLMSRIVAASDTPKTKPKTFVINADVLNAFALPGGFVYVFRGLIERSRSEAELAGVLGHEWAHVVARHGTRNMSRGVRTIIGLNVLNIALAVYANTGEQKDHKGAIEALRPLIVQLTQVGGVLHLLHKSREAELEADRLGAQYAFRAGFEPFGLADMFEVFKKESGGPATSFEKLLSTHPEHDARIAQNHDLAAFFFDPKNGATHSSPKYEIAKSAIETLALPSSETSVAAASAFISQVNGLIETGIAAKINQR